MKPSKNTVLPINLNLSFSRRNFLKVSTLAALTYVLQDNTSLLASNNTLDNILIINHKIQISSISKHIKPWFKLAILADSHISDRNVEIVHNAVKKINSIKPDLLLVSGDILDQKWRSLDLLSVFDGLLVPTYFSPGNHDYWVMWIEKYLSEYFKTNPHTTFLKNKQDIQTLNWTRIKIVGWWSHFAADFDVWKYDTKSKELSVLLSHEPRGAYKVNNFDLTVSWHTHWANRLILAVNKMMWNYGFTFEDIWLNSWLTVSEETVCKYFLTTNWIGKTKPEKEYNFRCSLPSIDVVEFV